MTKIFKLKGKKLEARLRIGRKMLDKPSLKRFGKGKFDGYRLIADDGKWALSYEPDDQGVYIVHMSVSPTRVCKASNRKEK